MRLHLQGTTPVRVARVERSWTQARLAERLHTTTRTVSKIERGQTNISLDTIRAYACELDLSLDDLIRDASPDRIPYCAARYFAGTSDAQAMKYTEEPIVFSEWAFVTGYQLQRSDYTFARLMQGDDEARDLFGKKKRKKREEQMTLFDADEPAEKPSDEGEFLKKYVTHYRRVWENEQ